MNLSTSHYKAKHLVNANLIINGTSYHGAIEECDILIPKSKNYEHKGGIAPLEVFTGFEKLEFKAKIKGLDAEVIKAISYDNSYKTIRIKGSLKSTDGNTPVNIECEAQLKIESDNFNSGNKAENSMNITFVCKYYDLNIDGNQLIQIDVENHKVLVDGVDMLQDERNHLGL
ncbi:phage major tail tube protein [Francisella philomiragia]|uniref:Phage tail tube FII family protein n=1 Tax=Francisella philomiragia TaxID=28110 RepID=A0A0B6D149_9GAMM|nr:phage major tail tube protein [Francisella philomiragia]AJI52591.1 phage tail tube FII family protein [Francisella philomiragia]